MGLRAEKKAALRVHLLTVAKRAFERDGYDNVSFRALAAEAEVSTGAFFGSFKDKKALWEAAIGRPAPDVITFLERVAIEKAGSQLCLDALELRSDLIGRG